MKFDELPMEQQQGIIDEICKHYHTKEERSKALILVKFKLELEEMKKEYEELPWTTKILRNIQGIFYWTMEKLGFQWI